MLRLLTRLPSSKFSEDLLTGVPVFDDFLRRLDAELLGRESLRRVTLEEVRDHLLEQQAVLLEQGIPGEASARQALDGFGSVAALGVEQRREVGRDFFKNFVLFGAMFAVAMAVLTAVSDLYGDFSWRIMAASFGFNFLFYGLFMSFFMTFSRIGNDGVQTPRPENSEAAPVIHVYTLAKSRIIASAMLLFSVSMIVTCLLSLMGLGLGKLYGFYGNVLMLYAGLILSSSMLACWTRITLDGDQLTYRSLFRHRQFQIAEVRVFKRQGVEKFYLPPALARSHVLTLVTDQGKTHSLYFSLSPEMCNSDQLIARLESMKSRREASA